MTPHDLRALLDRLGYGTAQAAEAVGCSQRSVQGYLAGEAAVPAAVARALEQHETMIRAGIAEPVPPPAKRGRPAKIPAA